MHKQHIFHFHISSEERKLISRFTKSTFLWTSLNPNLGECVCVCVARGGEGEGNFTPAGFSLLSQKQ